MSHLISVREDTGRKRVQTIYDPEEDPSRTVQSDRHEAEMKSILRKYEAVGIIDHMRNVDLMFRDVSEFEDFTDLMRQTKVAEAEFMKLPSKVREIFGHSVEAWLDAAHDPEKLEALTPQLVELGLVDAPPPPTSKPPEASPSSSGEVEDG